MSNTIYFSTDVEADGPIPGEYSMLSIGCAAYSSDGELLSTFSANLETLPGAKENAGTMAWWRTQVEAWQACRSNLQPAEAAMKDFVIWIKEVCTSHNGKAVFVGYPAGFDFTFCYWYLIKFAGESPFGFSALDIKSYAMAVLGKEFRATVKKNFPKDWFGKVKHNHQAVTDAIEQGEIFCNILKYSRKSTKTV